MMEYVGIIELGTKVDITDPCYDKDVWCRITTDCEPGAYKGYVEMSDQGDWGMRVASVSIFKGDKMWDIYEMDYIGNIGVDAGLAGFFNNKPDFKDDEWSELCDKIEKGNAWNLYDGIFSSSGFGDGVYNVYANEDRNAFTIVFIYDEECCEEDEEWD